MARQRASVQVNQFVGGINTEANPLNFPENSSFDELNMEFNLDGSRQIRRGFDLEDSYSSIDTGISESVGRILARTQHRWDNPGGLTGRQLLVVQVGNYMAIHNLDNTIISSETLYSKTFSTTLYDKQFSYAVVDGILVVVTGDKDVYIYTYDGTNITEETDRLLVRDLFGVETTIGSDTITDLQNLDIRPTTLPDEHLYNLRNQTWAYPRLKGSTNVPGFFDPINEFYTYGTYNKYPSNADSIIPHLVANSTFTISRTAERFHPADLQGNPDGNARAPIGHFIIDALDRGSSRLEQEAALVAEHPDLGYSLTTLPLDQTSSGPTALEQYAGRVWYAGFPAKVSDGDGKSPRLSSYLLFSQVVEESSQITNCFQEADPTSNVDPNLVDTDGGFIKIDGAYNIKSMKALGSSLFVFAENGVWQVLGSDSDSFRATSFSVVKMSEEGCINGNTVVVQEGNIFFWSHEDIYVISRDDKTGEWLFNSLTETTIKTLYSEITTNEKHTAIGYYDNANNSVRWLYGILLDEENAPRELVFNTKFGAFTKMSISTSNNVIGPISISGGQALNLEVQSVVTASAIDVTVGGDDVTVGEASITRDSSEGRYCIVIVKSPTITYSFGGYDETTLGDWDALGTPIYAEAYLVTNSVTGGDGRLRKDVPYLTVYFKEGTEDLPAAAESSCFIRSQWDWTTDITAGKWSNLRQAYRPARTSVGHTITSTRNKIRGFGNSVAFRFEAEEAKDLHIYGWDFNLSATTEE